MDELWFWIVAGRDGEMKGDDGLVVGWTVLVFFFAIDSYDSIKPKQGVCRMIPRNPRKLHWQAGVIAEFELN